MSSEEVKAVFDKEQTARDKYIYFVCGLAGALVAYMGKDYFPVHPMGTKEWLTVLSLISLTFCLAFGMAHMRCVITTLNHNKMVMLNKWDLKVCNTSIFKRKTGEANFSRDMTTGKEPTVEEIEAEIIKHQGLMADNQRKMNKWERWSLLTFVTCHVFLVLGFLMLIASKLAA